MAVLTFIACYMAVQQKAAARDKNPPDVENRAIPP